MTRRKPSRRWHRERRNDAFVKRRDREGERSRATYKLQELNEWERLLRPGRRVLDLGASPGGWSEFAARAVNPGGLVVAVDAVAMQTIEGVVILQGDCTEPRTVAALENTLAGTPVDVVLSDMAPNLSGVRATDAANSMALWMQTMRLSQRFLRPGGALLIKLFQYGDTDLFVGEIKPRFNRLIRRKPKASRDQSREFYVVGHGFKL